MSSVETARNSKMESVSSGEVNDEHIIHDGVIHDGDQPEMVHEVVAGEEIVFETVEVVSQNCVKDDVDELEAIKNEVQKYHPVRSVNGESADLHSTEEEVETTVVQNGVLGNDNIQNECYSGGGCEEVREEEIETTHPEAEVVLETLENATHVNEEEVIGDGAVTEEIIETDGEGGMVVDLDNQNDEVPSYGDVKPTAGHIYRGRKTHLKYKVLSNENDYAHHLSAKHMVDKDDPRSRLHFVKYLKREGKTHKIWECGICGKEFRHQYTLMRHLPTHTDERNFKCEVCNKAFRQMSTLSQHRAIHSDARPYVCEFCKKTFNRVSTLISHRKTHSDDKPHKCPICGKGFHQKGNLRNHIFTHTNERPYKCEACGKGFNQMSNLMCHKVKVSSNLMCHGNIKAHAHVEKARFFCNICNKEFPRKFSLRSHEEYKHGIKYRAGEKRTELDPSLFKDIRGNAMRRKDGFGSRKNLRIIHLPNGDRTLADIRDIRKGQLGLGKLQKFKVARLDVGMDYMSVEDAEAVSPETLTNSILSGTGSQHRVVQQPHSSYSVGRIHGAHKQSPPAGVVIDPIQTKAMQNARQSGQTPFALLKPAKGIPVLVKVMSAPGNKQMLVPATADDLKSAGKITVAPNTGQANGNMIKAVQIKVPVVATVIQRIGEDGQLSIHVEPPGPDPENDAENEPEPEPEQAEQEPEAEPREEEPDPETMTLLNPKLEPEMELIQQEGEVITEADEAEGPFGGPNVQYVREDGSIIPEEELQELNAANLLASAVVEEVEEGGDMENVQFVRRTGNGEYEVVSQEEAAELMEESGQTIEIVSDSPHIHQILGEMQEGGGVMDHNNLSALVEAIRSAGYQVTESDKQIVITDGGEQMIIEGEEQDPQDVFADQVMIGEDGEPIRMIDESQESAVDEMDAQVQFVIDESGAEGHTISMA